MKLTKNFKYFLSYIYPVPVEFTESKCNPFLEIVISDGRYSLNSRNTNYSFGTLHTLFSKIFRILDPDWRKINKTLILGFGTGSIAELVNKYNPDCIIDGVEIDEKVLDLGRKYFNTGTMRNVNIYCAPADTFIKECSKKYDLIIIDVFLDIIVPAELETEKFLLSLKNCMNPGGIVIFNKVIYTKTIKDQIPLLTGLYKKIFEKFELLTVMRSGKIFIAHNLSPKNK